MWDKYNFLCELGTEEIPAGYMPPAIDNIKNLLIKKLDEYRIDNKTIDIYATPRRLAIAIEGLSDNQRKESIELKGPSLDKGYDSDGNPTKALQGFMRGNSFEKKDLFEKETDKGTYLFAKKEAPVDETVNLIPEIVEFIVHNAVFPKKMKWSTKEVTFPRPLRYILTLLNDKKINFEIDGIVSDNKVRGHFIQSPDMIEINKISEYESKLLKASVIVDHKKRKDLINKELLKAAKECKGNLVDDEELLDIVTFIVEDPNIAICTFPEKFLKVPDIVLVAEMKEHQKYFAARNNECSLLNKFLVVSNNPVTDHIVKGNERVIAARFSDAEFFYNEDQKTTLEEKVESLKNVLFHKDLGSIYDKVKRVQKVALEISKSINLEKEITDKIQRAVLLAKADLNTAMVFEFTSLQGKIGEIYAKADGEDADVAAAINDHYKPRYQGDSLPENIISIVLSLSEKFDNIIGSYSVGNIPKGSQDPYALRRQAHAIIELLIKNRINLDMSLIFDTISSQYKESEKYKNMILEFFTARAKTCFLDEKINYDEFDACMTGSNHDYYQNFLKAQSLNDIKKESGFNEIIIGIKRMKNILGAFLKKNPDYSFKSIDEKLLKENEEKNMYNYFFSKKEETESYIKNNSYKSLFAIIVDGKNVIDEFFDKVMVMDDDQNVRDNRLALLNFITEPYDRVVDFTKIAE